MIRKLALCALMAISQPSRAATLYDDDVRSAMTELRSLMTQASFMPTGNSQGIVDLEVKLLNLQKNLHRVDEQSRRDALALQKQGVFPNYDLIKVSATCDELDLAVNLTWYYLDSRKNIYWQKAVEAAKSAIDLDKG